MTRLDHNRALTQLALKTDSKVTEIKNMAIWGNHSPTQYPDLHHASVLGRSALEQIDNEWYQEVFIPKVQNRGGEIIAARGVSSAASAAQAIVDHMHDWALGTAPGEIVSMGIVSDGSYGVEKGIIYSFPVRCDYGRYQIVGGLDISDWSRERMKLTEAELLEEKETINHLLPPETAASHENLSICLRSGMTLYYDGTGGPEETKYLSANRVL